MRLSIVNYGVGVNRDVPAEIKRENELLMAQAKGIVESLQMGQGAVIISEVMHTELPNLNKRVYKAKGMSKAAESFHTPHFTPFLMHHEDGFMNGSVVSVGTSVLAKYISRSVDTYTGKADGYIKVATFIPSNVMVGPSRSAIEAIQSRSFLTLSIGSRVDAKNQRCSICGATRADDEQCEHTPGRTYGKVVCYTEMYSPFFREYSAVYDPSDINAMISQMDVLERQGGAVEEEHVIDQIGGGWNLALFEIGKKLYPSVPVPSTESVEETDNTAAQESVTDSQAQSPEENDMPASENATLEALTALIEKFEANIAVKDKLIAKLATALSERLSDADRHAAADDEDDPQSSSAPEPSQGNAEGAVSGSSALEQETSPDVGSTEEPSPQEEQSPSNTGNAAESDTVSETVPPEASAGEEASTEEEVPASEEHTPAPSAETATEENENPDPQKAIQDLRQKLAKMRTAPVQTKVRVPFRFQGPKPAHTNS